MKKKKTKYYLKNNLIGLIIGGIIFGSLGVYAAITFPSNEVSFDPSNSTLSSTNVKDAIDELYEKCTNIPAGDTILDNTDIVTSGDGLYEDEYEEGKHIYKGADPNNYIYFNCTDINNQSSSTCDIWRIISIDSDKTIKIIREESIGNQNWDNSGSNNWARPASLNTYLNTTYYNGLNSTAQNQIVAKDFSIGAIIDNNNILEAQINSENSKKWNGKVALATVSEYLRTNSNKSSCKTIKLNNENYNSCKNTTWMDTTSVSWWYTLSPIVGDSDTVCGVDLSGYFVPRGCSYAPSDQIAIRPVVYLSSEVKITGGTGTKSDPYEISL